MQHNYKIQILTWTYVWKRVLIIKLDFDPRFKSAGLLFVNKFNNPYVCSLICLDLAVWFSVQFQIFFFSCFRFGLGSIMGFSFWFKRYMNRSFIYEFVFLFWFWFWFWFGYFVFSFVRITMFDCGFDQRFKSTGFIFSKFYNIL